MTLVRVTIVQDISTIVDLLPGENPLHETVFLVDPSTAFPTPEALEELAVAATGTVTPAGDLDARGVYVPPPDEFLEPEPEIIVMAHFSEDF